MKKLETYQRNGFSFQIVSRYGRFAYAVGKAKAGGTTHEVIEIQSHDGREAFGKYMPPAEYPPSNEQWGVKGWTFTCGIDALSKLDELAKNPLRPSPKGD